jgi:Flp pilus assembly protein TadG
MPTHRFLATLRRCGTDRSGASLIEFALIAPLLISLLGGATDLGGAIALSLRVENAARTAAQYITRKPSDTAGAQTVALTTLSGISGASVVVGAMVCQCPPAGSATGGAVVSCTNNTCATGVAQYVTVTATAPFTPIFPTSHLLPFDTITGTTGNVVVRLN